MALTSTQTLPSTTALVIESWSSKNAAKGWQLVWVKHLSNPTILRVVGYQGLQVCKICQEVIIYNGIWLLLFKKERFKGSVVRFFWSVESYSRVYFAISASQFTMWIRVLSQVAVWSILPYESQQPWKKKNLTYTPKKQAIPWEKNPLTELTKLTKLLPPKASSHQSLVCLRQTTHPPHRRRHWCHRSHSHSCHRSRGRGRRDRKSQHSDLQGERRIALFGIFH